MTACAKLNAGIMILESLMILINDGNGWVLADGFILDDIDVGYDIYCTDWDMLEEDAQCNHAHLSKLFDSVIVYCKDKNSLKRLNELKRKAAETLASDRRYDKADNAYSEAKKKFAEAHLTESLAKVRGCAGAAILFIVDAVMLYNGQYFKKGTKRAFDELKQNGRSSRQRRPVFFFYESAVFTRLCFMRSRKVSK